MRLHRVRLKNYRGVADCAVNFATQGVTIIEGDNEVGKSCIPEALNLILNKKIQDSSKSKEVNNVKPVHRDEGPEVEVVLSSGPYQLTFFKRWLRHPQTTLNVSTPRHEQLTSRKAHERVQEILEETLDQDLWKALRIEQDAPLNLPAFAGSSLGSALDRAAGGDVEDSGEDSLWDRIRDERERYWTRERGKETKGREALKNDVKAKQCSVEQLKEKLRAVENDANEMARLVEDERSLTIAQHTAAEDERKLEAQWGALEQLRVEVQSQRDHHQAAQARHQEVTERHNRRQDLIEELKIKTEELSGLEDEAEQVSLKLQPAKERAEQTASALKAAHNNLGKAEDALRLANEDREFHRELIEKEGLSRRHALIKAAQEDLGAALTTIQSSKVDDDLFAKIEDANFAVEVARSTRDASSARVETTALSRLAAIIDGEEVKLEVNSTRSSVVSQDWELVVPNIIRLQVRPGSESQDLASKTTAAEQEFDRLCAQGRVGGLDEARRKAEERKSAEQRRDRARERIELALQNLSLEELAQQVKSLTSSTAAYPAQRLSDSPLPDSSDDAKRTASTAEQAVKQCQHDLKQREDEAEEARESLQGIEQEAAELRGKISNSRSAHRQAKANLTNAREEQSDSNLNADLAAEAEKVDVASAALRRAEKALKAEDPESLELKLDNARGVKGRADETLRENQNRQRELAGGLEKSGEAGLHSQLSDTKRALVHFQRKQEQTEARAQAVRLLHETFSKHRQAARQRYVAPFKERIDRLGRIVFGPTFEAELGNDLKVERRTLDGITVDFDQLSVGAKEQLGVICRLACAAIVSTSDGGAPVVLDDALGWSDPDRLRTMGAVIAAAGRECQVIVLTCTPGRYADVGNAKVVRLRA